MATNIIEYILEYHIALYDLSSFMRNYSCVRLITKKKLRAIYIYTRSTMVDARASFR